jgi:hypothetical protein
MVDIMISEINERSNQDNINVINAIDKLAKLKICFTSIHFLSKHFMCNHDEFVAVIKLLQKHKVITKQI